MNRRVSLLLNCLLLGVGAVSAARLIAQWNELQPHIVVRDTASECDTVAIADQADHLATIAKAVIQARGSLPANPSEAADLISAEAKKSGFKWPGKYRLCPSGQICDCANEPFEISVGSDRVGVSSASLYAYYFAKLAPPNSATE